MQYLCARDTSVKSCQLYPADILIRSKIDETLCRVRDIKFFNFVGFLFGKGKTSEEKIKEFEDSFEEFLKFHPNFNKTGYLVGDHMTLADIALDCRLRFSFQCFLFVQILNLPVRIFSVFLELPATSSRNSLALRNFLSENRKWITTRW